MAPQTKTLLAALFATAIAGAAALSGDMTYYAPGLGACGKVSNSNEAVVAVAPAQYGNEPNPNNAPVCGRSISIHYGGKTASALVVDKCPECASGSIDVSPAVFGQLADMDLGRVQVTWEFA